MCPEFVLRHPETRRETMEIFDPNSDQQDHWSEHQQSQLHPQEGKDVEQAEDGGPQEVSA